MSFWFQNHLCDGNYWRKILVDFKKLFLVLQSSWFQSLGLHMVHWILIGVISSTEHEYSLEHHVVWPQNKQTDSTSNIFIVFISFPTSTPITSINSYKTLHSLPKVAMLPRRVAQLNSTLLLQTFMPSSCSWHTLWKEVMLDLRHRQAAERLGLYHICPWHLEPGSLGHQVGPYIKQIFEHRPPNISCTDT